MIDEIKEIEENNTWEEEQQQLEISKDARKVYVDEQQQWQLEEDAMKIYISNMSSLTLIKKTGLL